MPDGMSAANLNPNTISVEVLKPDASSSQFNVTIYELPSSCQRVVVHFVLGQESPDVRGFTKDDAQEFAGVVTDSFKSSIVAGT